MTTDGGSIEFRVAPIAVAAIGRQAAAWLVAVGLLAGTTVVAFSAVETRARMLFAAHRAAAPAAAEAPMGEVVGSMELTDGVVVKQAFDANRDGLAAIRLRTVTWGAETPDDHACVWSLVEHSADGRSRRTIREGTFPVNRARDWQTVELAFEPVPDSFAVRYTLKLVAGPGRPSRPAGLPLYASRASGSAGVRVARRSPAGEPAVAPVVPPAAVLEMQPVYLLPGRG